MTDFDRYFLKVIGLTFFLPLLAAFALVAIIDHFTK